MVTQNSLDLSTVEVGAALEIVAGGGAALL